MEVVYDKAPKFTDRILQETGFGFAVGALGSIPYHFYKGVTTMPRGSRIRGGLDYVRMNAPRTAGSFAVWSSIFNATDYAAAHLRRKEDPWNTVIGGATASAVLALRRGPGPIARAAVCAGLFMGLAEGMRLFQERASEEMKNSNVEFRVPVPVPILKEAKTEEEIMVDLLGGGL